MSGIDGFRIAVREVLDAHLERDLVHEEMFTLRDDRSALEKALARCFSAYSAT